MNLIKSIKLIESSGPHFYLVETEDGKVLTLPSVSNILSVVSKFGLPEWYGRKGLDEATRIRDESADIGTAVHAVIKKINTGIRINAIEWSTLSEPIQNCLRAFVRWKIAHNFIASSNELPVASISMKYAGTIDCIGIADGKTYVIDWKTGSFSPTNMMQLAAYYFANREMGFDIGFNIAGCRCVLLDKEKGIPTEHIVDIGSFLNEAYVAFLGAMKVWKYVREVGK